MVGGMEHKLKASQLKDPIDVPNRLRLLSEGLEVVSNPSGQFSC